eukprot:5474498-Prymnesium_polylepis.1
MRAAADAAPSAAPPATPPGEVASRRSSKAEIDFLIERMRLSAASCAADGGTTTDSASPPTSRPLQLTSSLYVPLTAA